MTRPPRCPIHRLTPLVVVTFCPACRGAQGGRATSPAKTAAARANARRRTRPLDPRGPTR